MLLELPQELLLYITIYLSPQDLIALSQVSKQLKQIMADKNLWTNKYKENKSNPNLTEYASLYLMTRATNLYQNITEFITHLQNKPYFLSIKGEEAEKLLIKMPPETYLLRPSTEKDCFTMSKVRLKSSETPNEQQSKIASFQNLENNPQRVNLFFNQFKTNTQYQILFEEPSQLLEVKHFRFQVFETKDKKIKFKDASDKGTPCDYSSWEDFLKTRTNLTPISQYEIKNDKTEKPKQ